MSQEKATRIWVRVSVSDKARIRKRMNELGMSNLSEYARQMLLSGQVVKREYQELKGLTAQIGRIGSNINQIARRANESRVVSKSEVDQLVSLLSQVLRIVESGVREALKN